MIVENDGESKNIQKYSSETISHEKIENKDDYKTDIAEIKGMLGKIFDRLESKADK